jgi:hypothetical protein
MFEYRLTSWPELPAQFDRVGYRRALSTMSQRFVSVAHLAQSSGLGRGDLLRLITLLESCGALARRERQGHRLFGALGRAGEWLESALGMQPPPPRHLRPLRADRRDSPRH